MIEPTLPNTASRVTVLPPRSICLTYWVGHHERQPVLACLGKDRGERIGDEVLKLVDVRKVVSPIRRRDAVDEVGTEQRRVILPHSAFAE